jgi:hypothetical protein
MAVFGSLAPGLNDENALLGQEPPDWREQEAQAGLAAQQEANRPSGVSTLWSAIKHPSLYPMFKGLMAAQDQPAPPIREDLPDVGPPLISPGPQISSGTRIGNALATALPEAVAGAIRSGATAPHRAVAGEIPMWGPTGRTSEEMVQAGSDLSALAGGASVAGTLERAATSPGRDVRLLGRQILASDTGKPGMAVAAAEHAPQYTTGIEGALDRIPSQELTAAQWLNQLKRYGAKPEELDWRKLGPALEGLGNAKISRAGIEQHLADNPVQLTSVVRKEPPAWENLSPEQQRYISEDADRRSDRMGVGRIDPQDHYEAMRDYQELPSKLFPQTRYPEYQLPGGENYRERLIQMPYEEPKYGVFHQGRQIGEAFDSGEAARNEVIAARQAGDTTYPTGTTIRQINDPQLFTSEHGSHWDEPNVLFHRRSTDRYFDQPLSEAEQAQNTQRASMADEISYLQQEQGQIGRQIGETARPLEQTRRRQIYDDMRSGRITHDEAVRRLETYDVPTEIKPLQDQLMELRRKEDEVRRNMPEQVQPKTIRSLHDEEAQSDWHQQGRDKGYSKPQPEGAPTLPTDVVPDAPFKGTGWERLALHDQLREAAEKGYPRISWTAGEDNTTNPMTMLRNQGRDISEVPADRQAEILRADRGIRDYYNRRRVDQANKIGKAHGVQVKLSELRGPQDVHATYHMDIPDSLRRELLTKPMSLFEDSGEAGKAAAVARQIEQQKGAGPREALSNWIEGLAGHGPETAPTGQAGLAEPAAPVAGGAGGGEARLGAAQAQAERAAGPYAPLKGLPTNPLKIGNDLFIPGPIAKVKDVAEQYMRDRLIPSYHRQPTEYHALDPEHSKNIAQAYEEMPHDPNNPAVKASYDAMIKETRDQYRAIRANHPELQLVPNAPGEDPYAATPRLAAKDVIENNRLHFFPTEQGFGTTGQGGIDMATHPMMQPSGETLNGKPLLNNDLFRIVHDYFGHLKEGYGFRAAGEDNAWRSHASMYSDLARPAMTTETRGQNSWVNFGPHGEANKGASAADTIYAPQKVGLMPEWTMRDRNSPAPIVVYQGSPHAFNQQDISKIGSGEGSGVYGHGLYFAEHSPISEWYRYQLAARHDPLLKKYKLDPDQGSRIGVDIANSKGDTAPVIADLQDHIENLKAKQAEGDTSMMTKNQIKDSTNMIRYMNDPNRAKGHLYQVAIDRPDEHFLHWDKPLKEQSQYVQDRVRPMLNSLTPKIQDARARLLAKAQEQMARLKGRGILNQKLEADIKRYSQPVSWEDAPGKNIYANAAHSALGKPPLNPSEAYPVATQYLRAKGIAGIKYAPGQNFAAPEGARGTHNYVTFEAPRILKRYALPGLLGGGALGGLALPQGGENGS